MTHSLLLADDSLTIRRVIELTFAEEELTVTTVGDGRRAIACIASLHPDIVLADAGMSSPDGYDIAAFVKGTPELAHIPVVLLTAAFQPIDEARARAAGCDAVLAKPFELTQLVARVKDLLRAADHDRSAGVPPAPGDDRHADVAPAAGTDRDGGVPPAAVASAVPSLDAYFDLIDTVVGSAGARLDELLPLALASAMPDLPAWDAAWGAGAEVEQPSLDDYFDLVDAAARQQPGPSAQSPLPGQRDEALVAAAEEPKTANEAGLPGDAGAERNSDPAEWPDAVTRAFLALLESAVALPPAPEVVERALRHLLATGETR